MKGRAHVFVSGRVQGVFFRSETKHEAVKRNVRGWVRNLHDGRVEAVFEGDEEAVRQLVEFCKKGPRGARVFRVDVNWQESRDEFENFRIKYRR